MDRKNIGGVRNAEIDLRNTGDYRGSENKRDMGGDGFYFPFNTRLYNKKMGTALLKIGNVFGWTAVFAAILADVDAFLRILIGVAALWFLVVKAMHATENMLFRRIERKEREDAYKLNKK
jgi:hypothetical protein